MQGSAPPQPGGDPALHSPAAVQGSTILVLVEDPVPAQHWLAEGWGRTCLSQWPWWEGWHWAEYPSPGLQSCCDVGSSTGLGEGGGQALGAPRVGLVLGGSGD